MMCFSLNGNTRFIFLKNRLENGLESLLILFLTRQKKKINKNPSMTLFLKKIQVYKKPSPNW